MGLTKPFIFSEDALRYCRETYAYLPYNIPDALAGEHYGNYGLYDNTKRKVDYGAHLLPQFDLAELCSFFPSCEKGQDLQKTIDDLTVHIVTRNDRDIPTDALGTYDSSNNCIFIWIDSIVDTIWHFKKFPIGPEEDCSLGFDVSAGYQIIFQYVLIYLLLRALLSNAMQHSQTKSNKAKTVCTAICAYLYMQKDPEYVFKYIDDFISNQPPEYKDALNLLPPHCDDLTAKTLLLNEVKNLIK